MKNSNSVAVQKRRLRASLKTLGSSEQVIEDVLKQTFGGSEGPKLNAIPRTVTRNMLRLFNKLGRPSTLAVSWGKNGKFRAFTDKGYKALMDSGKRLGHSNKGRNERKKADAAAAHDKK